MAMEHRPLVVVGAGASGMAASIAAAQSGVAPCLLEASAKAGRSVMAAGNGRCNFANADLSPERYNEPAFVAAAMGDEPLAPILGFFEALGLWYVADDEGRLFPRSRAAASVLDVLLAAMDERGVGPRLDARVVGVGRRDGGWYVALESGERLSCDALVWAAGGGSADAVASGAGLPLVPERAALCPLACDPRPGKPLDGVRVPCAVSLLSGRSTVARRDGEVLFRPYGLSGIAVFDLSRLARPGDVLSLDLLPDVGEGQLASLLSDRLERRSARCSAREGCLGFLDGALHPKVGRHLMAIACGPDARLPIDCGRLAALMKGWEFTVTGTADETHAQVVQGGLATSAFDPLTLEARQAPGFFACGEALDVDGECGGMNLAWAWSSGMVAGVAAARHVLRC